MARYKPRDAHLSKLLPVKFSEQILPGSFEYALNWLIDHDVDLSVFDARFHNDETGTSLRLPISSRHSLLKSPRTFGMCCWSATSRAQSANRCLRWTAASCRPMPARSGAARAAT